MKVNWEKLENNTGVLTVEVDVDRVEAALDKVFKKTARTLNTPGFRKGKIPRSIFDKRYGVESLYADAIDDLLPEVYMEAVAQAEIEPIDQPDISIDQFATGQEFKFTAKVQVEPEVQLGEYKGVEVEEQDPEVTEGELQDELEKLRKRHAELVVIDEGAAQDGDVVVIDFEGFLNDEPFEGGKAEKYELELGSGSFIPGFEEQIVGMEHGDEKDIEVTFPEEYHSEELKGQAVVFKVKLHDIKRKNLPALDDEFAKDVSEFDTLDEYKEDLKKELQERKTNQVKIEKENFVVDQAVAAASVDIPEVMIDNDVHSRMHDLEHQLSHQGLNLDLYFQIYGGNRESMEQQFRDDAGKRIRNNLVLRAIAAAENLEVPEEVLLEELQKIAEANKRDVEAVREQMQKNGNLNRLKGDLVIRQAIDFLIDNSKSVPKK